jgi:broad specificity phosphatase PhoE
VTVITAFSPVRDVIIEPCCDEDPHAAARSPAGEVAAVRLYVIRHAHAGSRSQWHGRDDDRPLSKKGRRQATAIADRLADAGITELVSSPATRCIQTLEPLGEMLGLAVATDGRLNEGGTGEEALKLAGELTVMNGRAAAVCSHGDVIPELLRSLRGHCATRIDDPFAWPKASTWVVTWDGHRWATARYVPPPA